MDEDYAVLLQQACNVAQSVPMDHTGIVYYFDESVPLGRQSPVTFPPLTPVIFALPVYMLGYDLWSLKLIQLLLLVTGVVYFAVLMRRWGYSYLEIAASLALFWTSFEVRRSTDSIGSDLPFIPFIMLALDALDRFCGIETKRRIFAAIVAGAALFLAINLRTVAVALVPAFLYVDWFKRRAISLDVFLVLAAAGVFVILERLFLFPSDSYGFIARFAFLTPFENLRQFYYALAVPWAGSEFERVADAALLMFGALAAVAVVSGVLKGKIECAFLAAYTGILLVLPDFDAGARYLTPHLLFFGALICRGTTIVASLVPLKVPSYAFPSAAGALALVLFLTGQAPFPDGPRTFGVHSPSTQQALQFLRTSASPEAIVAATKFRSIHLFTDRTTIKVPLQSPDLAALAAWARQHDVRYVLIKQTPPSARFDFTDCPANPLCQAGPDSAGFAKVFSNADFTIFEVVGRGVAPANLSDPAQSRTLSGAGRCRR